jgi:hypothetical protein
VHFGNCPAQTSTFWCVARWLSFAVTPQVGCPNRQIPRIDSTLQIGLGAAAARPSPPSREISGQSEKPSSARGGGTMAAFSDADMSEWLAKQASLAEGKPEAWVAETASQLASKGFLTPRDLVTLNVSGWAWADGCG